MGKPLFLFDGQAIPGNPARGYLEESEQLVDSARNANGQVVAQKINRRLRKFDSIRWPILTTAQVTWLKQKVANFTVMLTYYDSEDGGIVTRKFYFGDMSAEPFEWDIENYQVAVPTRYKDVAVNIIDMRILNKLDNSKVRETTEELRVMSSMVSLIANEKKKRNKINMLKVLRLSKRYDIIKI